MAHDPIARLVRRADCHTPATMGRQATPFTDSFGAEGRVTVDIRGVSLDATDLGARLERLRGVLPLTQAPRLVAGVLAVALAAAVAREGLDIHWAITASTAATSRNSVKPDTRSGKSGGWSSAVQGLVSAHLFGLAPTSARELTAVAQRDTTLVLTGTISTPDPSSGMALIGASAQTADVHPVGDSVTGGVVLRAVYRDHVIVDRSGQLSAVFLRRDDKAALAPLLAQSTESDAAEAADHKDAADSQRQEIEHTLQEESDRTAAFLRQEPFYSQGQFRGVVIEPGSDPEMLAELGLKAGDVLQHVDGAVVVDPDRLDMLRKRLASGRPVTVSVIRPGVGPLDVTIASGAVAGMIAN